MNPNVLFIRRGAIAKIHGLNEIAQFSDSILNFVGNPRYILRFKQIQSLAGAPDSAALTHGAALPEKSICIMLISIKSRINPDFYPIEPVI